MGSMLQIRKGWGWKTGCRPLFVTSNVHLIYNFSLLLHFFHLIQILNVIILNTEIVVVRYAYVDAGHNTTLAGGWSGPLTAAVWCISAALVPHDNYVHSLSVVQFFNRSFV